MLIGASRHSALSIERLATDDVLLMRRPSNQSWPSDDMLLAACFSVDWRRVLEMHCSKPMMCNDVAVSMRDRGGEKAIVMG